MTMDEAMYRRHLLEDGYTPEEAEDLVADLAERRREERRDDELEADCPD